MTESLLQHRVVRLNPSDAGLPESNFENVYSFSQLYDIFLDQNPLAYEKITQFKQKVAGRYSPVEAQYIGRALIIATVAHQFNWNVDDRFRKKRDPDTNLPIPYIYHPLEMADRLVDEKLNWVAVSAILMHDVAEDVQLGDGLNTRGEWFDILRNEFHDTGKADLLLELINGVTERELPDRNSEEGPTLRKQLRQSQMYKMIAPYLTRGRLKGRDQSRGGREEYVREKELTIDQQEAIYEVVYNLNHLFESALHSPERLQILILKITDIWHNFNSPKWIKPAKVLRARLAAGIAEWMGWYSMRSDLIYQLAEIANTNSPYAPILPRSKLLPSFHQRDLSDFEDIAYEILGKLSERYGMKTNTILVFAGMPVVHTDYQLPAWEDTSLPVPEIIFQTPGAQQSILENILQDESPRWGLYVNTPDKRSKKGYLSTRMKPLENLTTQKFVRQLGRRRVDFRVKVGNEKSFTARFEDRDTPYVIDIFRRNSSVEFSQVPEARGLFHNRLLHTDLWNLHLASLIGFLYEPNMSVQLGNYIFGILINGNLYFVNGNQTFAEFGKQLGVDLLKDRKIFTRGIERDNIEGKTKLSEVPRGFQGNTFEDRLIVIE